jgi:chromosome segregation ATPase
MSYGGMNDADLWFKRCQDLEARVKELEAARAPLLEENERLKGVEELYNAGIQVWNPVYESILNERDSLRAQVEGLTNKCALLAASWKKAEDELEKMRAAQPKTSR